MRALNQCAQRAHGVSESVVHTARGEAGGGVSQGRAEADARQGQMVVVARDTRVGHSALFRLYLRLLSDYTSRKGVEYYALCYCHL